MNLKFLRNFSHFKSLSFKINEGLIEQEKMHNLIINKNFDFFNVFQKYFLKYMAKKFVYCLTFGEKIPSKSIK